MLTPHSADDWDAILGGLDRQPPPGCTGRPSDAELEAFVEFNLRAGPFVTDDVLRVGQVVRRVQRANEAAAVGGRRVVIVNGPFHHGKTHAVLVAALQQVKQGKESRVGSPHAVLPAVYVELLTLGAGKSLVEAILSDTGAPVSTRATMPQLTRTLRRIAPGIGLRLVIVDDLGSAASKNGGHDSPGTMATALKSLIGQIPATFVLVGGGLAESPMFSQTRPVAPAQQVLRRSTWVELEPWPKPGAKPGPWHRLVATMGKHLAFPTAGQFAIRNQQGVATVHELSEGRPGTAMELVQNAAVAAIEQRRKVDPPLLRRVAKELRGDRA